MKKLILMPLFLICHLAFSQNKWQLFKNEQVTTKKIHTTESFTIDELTFSAQWDEQLSFTENIGYYGGIARLKIYKDGQEIQTIKNLEDGLILGYVIFDFYDFNLDGHLDFAVPISSGKSRWDKYFIYNPHTKKFEHRKEWDYLRIQKIDKEKKQLLSQPDGMQDNRKKYQIEGVQLIEIKREQ